MMADRWDEAVDVLDRWNQTHPDREDLFVGDRAQIAAAVAGLREGTLTRPAELFVSRSTQWMMLGQPDSAVVELLANAENVPFGRTLEMRRRGLEPLLSDPRIEAFFAERGLSSADVQRTPVAERTRPLALRAARK
jgi:hypothetical protein